MSKPPLPPLRSDARNSVNPSLEMPGSQSFAAVLTEEPRFTGGPNEDDRVALAATQMSSPPNPPGRLEQKYRSRLSAEMLGKPSQQAWLPRSSSAAFANGSDALERVAMKTWPSGDRSKKSSRPSAEMLGAPSSALELTAGPSFCNLLNASEVEDRLATHISPPFVTSRSVMKYSSSPSGEIDGPPSKSSLFNGASRFATFPNVGNDVAAGAGTVPLPHPTHRTTLTTATVRLTYTRRATSSSTKPKCGFCWRW